MRIKEAMCLYGTILVLIHNPFLLYIEFIVFCSFQIQSKNYPKILLNSIGPKFFKMGPEFVSNVFHIPLVPYSIRGQLNY